MSKKLTAEQSLALIRHALTMAQKVCHERFCDPHPMGQAEVCKATAEAAVLLDHYAATARKEAFKEARHRVYMISGSTNVDPSVRKGFAAGVQAAIEVIAALERAATTDTDKTERG